MYMQHLPERLPADPMLLLEQTKALTLLSSQLGSIEPTGQLDDVALDAPIPRPRNSFAIGLNYRNHAVEAGLPIPPAPMVFTKYPSCITGPTANIEMRSDYVDFEGELVAVIGKTAKNVALEDALDCIAGLCIGQDISDRPSAVHLRAASIQPRKIFRHLRAHRSSVDFHR